MIKTSPLIIERIIPLYATGALRKCNFQGYQRNSVYNFQELIKNQVDLPMVTKKNNVEFPGVLVFGLGIFNILT